MSKNMRIAAFCLLGAALVALPVMMAAAKGRGGGHGGGGGRGGGGHVGHSGGHMGHSGGHFGHGGGRGGGGHVGHSGGHVGRGGGHVGHSGGHFGRGGAHVGHSGGQARSSVGAAPRVQSQAAPRGEFRAAPSAQRRAAPGTTPGTVRRPESWNRDWARHHGSLGSRSHAAHDWHRGSLHHGHLGHGKGHVAHHFGDGKGHVGHHFGDGKGHVAHHFGHGKGHAGHHFHHFHSPWYWSYFWWPGYYGYYGGGYPYYSYGYQYPYYGDKVYDEGGYGIAPYAAAAVPDESMTAVAPETQTEGSEFYDRALTAFQKGELRNAMRLAAHAAIDDPEDANVHLLLSLAMFAQGDYQGAAMEAHGLAAMGKIPDWEMVFGFYGKSEPYEKQLRALEKFVGENPSAPEGRFLLGFHYMMAGHRDAAQSEFLETLKVASDDRLAAELLTHVGGRVPADIAQRQSQAPTQPPVHPQGKPPAKPLAKPAPPQVAPKASPEPVIPLAPIRKY